MCDLMGTLVTWLRSHSGERRLWVLSCKIVEALSAFCWEEPLTLKPWGIVSSVSRGISLFFPKGKMKLSSVSSLWLFFTEAVSESFWKWCGEHSSKGKGSSTRRNLTVEHLRWVWCVGATVGVKIRLHAFEAYRLRIWVWCVSVYSENKWEHTK